MDKSCMLWFHVVWNASCCILKSNLVGHEGSFYTDVQIQHDTYRYLIQIHAMRDIYILYYIIIYIFIYYTYITVQHRDDIYRFDSYWFGSFISSLEWSNPVLGSRRKGSREMPVNLYEFCIILLSIRCTMKLAAGPREIKSNSNWRKNPSWLVCIRKNWTKVLNSCIHLGHWHSSLHLISQMGT